MLQLSSYQTKINITNARPVLSPTCLVELNRSSTENDFHGKISGKYSVKQVSLMQNY